MNYKTKTFSCKKISAGGKPFTTDAGKKLPITEDSESVLELQRIFREY